MHTFLNFGFWKVTIFLVFIVQFSSATLLSGLMLNYIIGSYVARNAIDTAIRNTIRTANSLNMGNENITYPTTSPLTAIAEVANLFGINNYIKEAFDLGYDDIESCDGKNCKKRKKKNTGSDEEFTESEEKFLIQRDEENLEQLAEDELAEEEPMNYLYILRDRKDRLKNNPRVTPPPHPSTLTTPKPYISIKWQRTGLTGSAENRPPKNAVMTHRQPRVVFPHPQSIFRPRILPIWFKLAPVQHPYFRMAPRLGRHTSPPMRMHRRPLSNFLFRN